MKFYEQSSWFGEWGKKCLRKYFFARFATWLSCVLCPLYVHTHAHIYTYGCRFKWRIDAVGWRHAFAWKSGTLFIAIFLFYAHYFIVLAKRFKYIYLRSFFILYLYQRPYDARNSNVVIVVVGVRWQVLCKSRVNILSN